MSMVMANFPRKHRNKKQSLLFLVLILTLAVFGQDQDNYDYDYNGNSNEEETTIAPREITTASPEAAREDRLVERILAKLNGTLANLNFNMDRMNHRISRVEEAVASRSSPSPPGSVPTRSSTIFPTNDNAQTKTNTRMIGQLQDLVLSLQNQTGNSQSYNETAASILELSTQFQTELQGIGIRIDTLANYLSNQNLENLQITFTRLSRLDQFMDTLEREKKEEKRVKVVKNLLEAWGNGQNETVKALLNDITNENQLNSSMAEIVEGMFDGNIRNYPKIIALFRSTKSEQYRAGLTSLIDLFHSTSRSGGGKGSAVGGRTSNTNTNTNSQSLLDEPEYLELAYLAKSEFGRELQLKFPKLVQTLVFTKKVCVRNLPSNYYLSVDKDEGLKDGGFFVYSRKKSPKFTTAVLCDWEISSPIVGASFIIRQKSQAETLNLNVLEGSVFAGSDDYNPSYFWKIQLRENAQKVTFQNVPARTEDSSYFLCSVKPLNGTERKLPRRSLELFESVRPSCEWTVDSPQ